MEFSEPFQVAGPVAYSPDGVLVAAIVDGMRVAVRQAETLRVVRVCECCDLVQHIEWSGDSKHLLCAQLLRARVWVFSISADASSDLVQAPVAKIDEGVCGLSWARFAPDGAHVLTCSQFNIRLTIWDLASRHHRYIENPKNPEKALDFDAEGKLLAVSHRRTFKDYIHLYATENWTQIATWEAGTTNLVGLAFAPNGAFLCAWDGPLYYNVCVYAVPKGERLMAYSAYEDALAIKSVQWTPNSMLLAIGSYDQRVRIVNYLTWKVVCELSHLAGAVNTPTVAVYIESRSGATDSSQYVLGKVPFSVPEVVADPDRDASAKFGVGLMEWCPNSDYLATRNDNQPTCVYVWMTKTLSLACVLVHLAPVRAITWSRTRTQLLIVTDSSRLFTWTPGGAACVTIPADGFQATGCLTNPCQDSFVVWDRSQAVAGFIDDERC